MVRVLEEPECVRVPKEKPAPLNSVPVPDITNVADVAETLPAFVALKLEKRPLQVIVDVPKISMPP
jgi:hypothetical protein